MNIWRWNAGFQARMTTAFHPAPFKAQVRERDPVSQCQCCLATRAALVTRRCGAFVRALRYLASEVATRTHRVSESQRAGRSMEIEGSYDTPSAFQVFKDNTVQDILKESETVDMTSSAESLASRLKAPFLTNGCLSALTDHLVLTSAAAVSPALLEALDVACVVNVAPELPDTPLHNGDVIYCKVPIVDSGNSRIYPYFDQTADLIHNVVSEGRRSLVYCVAGVSRSASICIAYLMKYHEMNLLTAYNYVKSRRPRIRPNCGFFKQLIEYEESLYGTNSIRIVWNEIVQMEIPDVYDSEYKLVSNYRKRIGENGRY